MPVSSNFSVESLPSIQPGTARPTKIENPTMTRFLVESRSTFFKLDRPTAAIIPNITKNMPPVNIKEYKTVFTKTKNNKVVIIILYYSTKR